MLTAAFEAVAKSWAATDLTTVAASSLPSLESFTALSALPLREK
jgi:hypothetical protein